MGSNTFPPDGGRPLFSRRSQSGAYRGHLVTESERSNTERRFADHPARRRRAWLLGGACVCAVGLAAGVGPTAGAAGSAAGARGAAGGGKAAAVSGTSVVSAVSKGSAASAGSAASTASTASTASGGLRVATPVAEHRYRAGFGLVANPWQPTYLSSQFTPSWRGAYGGYTILDGAGKMKAGLWLTQQARSVVFRTPFITVHGIHYAIPAQYRGQFLLVLPLRTGIVWIPVNRANGGQPRFGDAQVFAFRHPLTYPIYVTPYRTTGGSLLDGAHLIATLPQKWLGAAQARGATAWTGWLPQGAVARAHLGALTSEAMTFHDSKGGYESVATVRPLGGRIPVWPGYFAGTVGHIGPHQTPLVAWPWSITRTQGGFVLNVSLRWAPSGANAGMTGANYYYSMRTGKWTPLNQVYMVQTLTGTQDVGSQAVFWQQPLGTRGNQTAIPQLWFDPETDSIQSVWIGNWVNGPSYIDGGTLLFQSKSSGRKPSSTWMTYSPPGRPMSLYESTVTLPDGRVVADSGAPPLTWEGMSVSLQAQGMLQAQGADGPSVMRGLIGNHADVLKTSTVRLPVGQAYAAIVRRTAPAAAGSTPPRYEYWLAVLRPEPLHPGRKVAYCLVGVSRTNQLADLAKLETLAAAWVLPTSQEAR